MQLKRELEDRIHLHKNLEQLYDGKLQTTKAQLDASAKKSEEYSKMVKYLQKKLSIEKDAMNKVCSVVRIQRLYSRRQPNFYGQKICSNEILIRLVSVWRTDEKRND